MAKQHYQLSELIKAIQHYTPPQKGADTTQSLRARIRIGGSANILGQHQETKSTSRRAYAIDKVNTALASEKDPYRQLLFHNVLLRLDFSYGRFLNAVRALQRAPLSYIEAHASWHTLWVHRFTTMEAFTPTQWAKSGALLRSTYAPLVDQAKRRYTSLIEGTEACGHIGENGLHIVIANTEFLESNHPLTKQALDLASALTQHHDARVSILNASIPPRLPVGYFGDQTVGRIDTQFQEIREIDFGGEKFGFRQNPHPILNGHSFQWYAEQLAQLKPSSVITLGPGNILSDSFAQICPTLAFPHTGDVPFSTAPMLCTIAAPAPIQQRLNTRAGVTQGTVHVIPTAFQLPTDLAAVERTTFGFPSDATLGVVVGSRLQSECTPDFLSILDHAVIAQPSLHIVFIGPVHGFKKWLERYPRLAKQSIALGFQTHVMNIVKACDVYINPFRLGGGTSAACAILNEKPVITLNRGDVADIMGKRHCAPHMDAFRQLLVDCASKQDVYETLSAHAAHRWAAKSDMSAMTRAVMALLDKPQHQPSGSHDPSTPAAIAAAH